MKIIKGIGGAPGLVHGELVYFEKSGGGERTDFDTAVQKTLESVRRSYKETLRELGEENAKIFSAYEMLLEDSMLTDPIKAEIENGTAAEEAIKSITEAMAKILESKNNEYTRQRADDIRHIGKMLTDAVNGSDGGFSFPEGGEKFILAAHELTPVDTMSFDRSRLAGMITERGGATSHTVILAKSLGIPAVVGAAGLMDEKLTGEAFLDGYGGVLAVQPEGEAREIYEKKLAEEKALMAELDKIKSSDAETLDKKRIAVCVNIGKPSDLKEAAGLNYDGVGLFRSEFLYSSESKKPSLSEQTEAYKAAIDMAYPRPVTIRTLDVGGDKQLSYLNMKTEENPFLGNRGIRLCLNNKEIFCEQLEAILLAAAGKSVKVMLPMITSVSEIKKARALIDEVREKLKNENKPFCEKLSLGIMVETPASAVIAETLAKHCDFFSIGTNDLVQYVTAADRGNADVENVYDPHHPAALKLIAHVISVGKKAGIEVSVCGDLAANTEFTELLIGMGLEKFSVPLPAVTRIKHKISSVSSADAELLYKIALSAEDADEVKNILKGEWKK